MPKVSVIVPVYRVEKYIARCIESIQKQTLTDWELILVDDVGGDKSMEIVKNYATTDKRIKIIESNENVGPMIAREKGYKVSIGEYVTFVDGDDTLLDCALEKMYNAAINNNADIVSGKIEMVSSTGTRNKLGNCKLEGCCERKAVMQKILTGEVTQNVCSKLFRGELLRVNTIDNYNGFKNGEDAYLFLQILMYSHNIYFIKDVVYEYFLNSNSSTHIDFTEKTVIGMAAFARYQYSLFSKELGNIDDLFFKKMINGIYYISMRYPYKNIKKIYQAEGVAFDMSFRNLVRYYPFIQAIKKYVVIHFYYQIKSVFK